jgi:hypothetical protein
VQITTDSSVQAVYQKVNKVFFMMTSKMKHLYCFLTKYTFLMVHEDFLEIVRRPMKVVATYTLRKAELPRQFLCDYKRWLRSMF